MSDIVLTHVRTRNWIYQTRVPKLRTSSNCLGFRTILYPYPLGPGVFGVSVRKMRVWGWIYSPVNVQRTKPPVTFEATKLFPWINKYLVKRGIVAVRFCDSPLRCKAKSVVSVHENPGSIKLAKILPRDNFHTKRSTLLRRVYIFLWQIAWTTRMPDS